MCRKERTKDDLEAELSRLVDLIWRLSERGRILDLQAANVWHQHATLEGRADAVQDKLWALERKEASDGHS